MFPPLISRMLKFIYYFIYGLCVGVWSASLPCRINSRETPFIKHFSLSGGRGEERTVTADSGVTRRADWH